MQSETLKYLYLLFEDDSVLPLSSTLSLALLFSVVLQITDMNRAEYVFNTEVGFSAALLLPCDSFADPFIHPFTPARRTHSQSSRHRGGRTSETQGPGPRRRAYAEPTWNSKNKYSCIRNTVYCYSSSSAIDGQGILQACNVYGWVHQAYIRRRRLDGAHIGA